MPVPSPATPSLSSRSHRQAYRLCCAAWVFLYPWKLTVCVVRKVGVGGDSTGYRDHSGYQCCGRGACMGLGCCCCCDTRWSRKVEASMSFGLLSLAVRSRTRGANGTGVNSSVCAVSTRIGTNSSAGIVRVLRLGPKLCMYPAFTMCLKYRAACPCDMPYLEFRSPRVRGGPARR